MFKHIRSFVGKFFDENQQMWVVMYLSEFYWFLRKYFLAVEITYPEDFLKNWSIIKHYSSQDKERNFTVYQMIKVHNEIFKGRKTNLIEFGVDRGGTLTTISKFAKNESHIYALDSFGYFADDIKKNVTKYDPHYMGRYKPFTKKTRFKDFDHKKMTNDLNEILIKKNSKLETIVGYFPNLDENKLKKISNIKYSFVHLDF